MNTDEYIAPPETKDYMFMASTHGLDSLVPVDPKCFHGMVMACDFNQHRYAICGTITLTKPVYEAFQSMMMNDEEKQIALKMMKKTVYRFPTGKVSQYKHNMAIIPNPALDPWGGKRYDCETETVEVTSCPI
jgi:hypothetical protein